MCLMGRMPRAMEFSWKNNELIGFVTSAAHARCSQTIQEKRIQAEARRCLGMAVIVPQTGNLCYHKHSAKKPHGAPLHKASHAFDMTAPTG